jgi:SAM-dependent methyltransferase
MSQLNLSDLHQTDLKQLDVVSRYSEFAPVYEESVSNWGYQCYRTAADLLQPYVKYDQPILDAGCGTGLVGKALYELGYRQLTGIDISPDMLERAKPLGCYQHLQLQDLSALPYPFADNQFTAIACVGVFSLIADPRPVLQEFWRLLQPAGYLVFTQQAALFEKYDYAGLLDAFEQRGEFQRIAISDPVIYLPQREGYEERTVIYCTYQIHKSS